MRLFGCKSRLLHVIWVWRKVWNLYEMTRKRFGWWGREPWNWRCIIRSNDLTSVVLMFMYLYRWRFLFTSVGGYFWILGFSVLSVQFVYLYLFWSAAVSLLPFSEWMRCNAARRPAKHSAGKRCIIIIILGSCPAVSLTLKDCRLTSANCDGRLALSSNQLFEISLRNLAFNELQFNPDQLIKIRWPSSEGRPGRPGVVLTDCWMANFSELDAFHCSILWTLVLVFNTDGLSWNVVHLKVSQRFKNSICPCCNLKKRQLIYLTCLE